MEHYFLAIALLFSSYDEEYSPVFSAIGPTIQVIAIEREILDYREIRYVLTRPEDFKSDLRLLQRRNKELINAPYTSDSARLPERVLVNEFLKFNREYRSNLSALKEIDLVNTETITTTISETDKLYQVWDLIRDCRCEYYYISVRRLALKKLFELIGPNNYYSGQYPPYVPFYRFRRIGE